MSDVTPSPVPTTELSGQDQRLWATLIHVGWVVGSIIGLSFLPALIGYIVLKDRGAFVRQHTAAALNFQISWFIWAIALAILSLITWGLGLILYIPFTVLYLIFTIMDALHANKGEAPGQTLSLPLVR